MNELKEGDVVLLKSGGPEMTIREINGKTVGCQWFDDKELVYGTFVKEQLIKKDSASN
jgi:uncharacterized protein YodC (DUF2158 family)